MQARQRKFAVNYAELGNGAEAARQAGYSPRCAKQTAHKLLALDHVQRAIEQEQWFVDRDSRSAKSRATGLLMEAFHTARSTTEKLKAVDALCKLHGLVRWHSGDLWWPGCPQCTNQSSRAEIRLLTEFRYLFSSSQSRIKFEGREADIFLEEINLVIEYDGAHWHKGKELKDREKSEFFELLGKRVIRVRERPLSSVTRNCVEVSDDIFTNKSEVDRVLSFILSNFSSAIPNEKLVLIRHYLNSSDFQNDTEYRKYLSYFPSPFPEHSLQELFPEVAREWHPTKNAPLTPRHFTPKTDAVVWWICGSGHEWEAPIANRTPSKNKPTGSGCPYCSGRKASPKNNIRNTFPEFVDEWHPSKNGANTPDSISFGNRTIDIWWVCDRGHEWVSTANRRFGNVKRRGHKSIKTCPHC